MKGYYKPRKKKPVPIVRQMKTVRIDRNTQIEVSVSIPDDVAIERYYMLHKNAIRPPIDEVEELQDAIIDDTNLLETE